MHVHGRRHLAAILRRTRAHVRSHGGGDIQTIPAHQLRAPGEIGVFAIREKVVIEKFRCAVGRGNRDRIDHGPRIQRCRARRSENVLRLHVLAAVFLASIAIEVPQLRREVHARGVEASGDGGHQASTRHADRRIVPGVEAGNECGDKFRRQHNVGIQHQHPLAATLRDGLVLAAAKSAIHAVANQAQRQASRESRNEGARVIGGCVVDDHDFQRRIVLQAERFQARGHVFAAVVGYDRDADQRLHFGPILLRSALLGQQSCVSGRLTLPR